MKNSIINKLLSNEVLNPVTGDPISIPIRKISIAQSALQTLPSVLKELKLSKKVAIVSDDNTHVAAGAEVERILCKGYEVTSVVLPDGVFADEENLKMLTAYLSRCDYAIAVGGGTINDLVKYACYLLNKEYISVPTCPSVNGFSSSNASIEIGGIKKTLKAILPIAIVVDIDVLIQAPRRLTISGVGDSLARSTAQADWLLSHYILGTEYNSLPFDLVRDAEKFVFKNISKLFDPSGEVMEGLMQLLILSGLGMHLAGSSSPASQAEHLISHYMDTVFEGEVPLTYHGEQVAVTSVAMSKIQTDILSRKEIKINRIVYSEKPVLKHFGEEIGSKLLPELKHKEIDEQKADKINKKLEKSWAKISKEIRAVTISTEDMENIMKAIHGPYTYKHLGWTHEQFQVAVQFAPFLRNRFTFLDLAMGIS